MMKPAPIRTTRMLALAAALCASAVMLPSQAQNSFGDPVAPKRPVDSGQTPPLSADRPRPPGVAPRTTTERPSDAGETQDFGVKPVSQLRPSDQLHGPTPTSIPGGRVVAAKQLSQMMQGQQGQQGRVMLLHTIGSRVHLPNAIPAVPASQGGSFDDPVQRDFGAYLQGATGGDRSRLIVTYCQGVHCWGSYNAALRAIKLGYTNVHWFRGGLEGWHQAGLPLSTEPAPGAGGQPPPDAPSR